jgi:hypothetical protein
VNPCSQVAPCASFAHAYNLAQPGTTVYMLGGTYTKAQSFASATPKPAGLACTPSDLSGCITFMPVPGQTPVLRAAAATQLLVCQNLVRIVGLQIQQTTFVDQYGDTLSNNSVEISAAKADCPSQVASNDIIEGSSLGGQGGIFGPADNVWFVNDVMASTSGLPWKVMGSTNSGFIGNVFQGFNFANVDSLHHHMECFHVDYSSAGLTFRGNRFQGCPVYSIRFEAEGSTGGSQTGHLVENNFFDGASLNFDCHDNGCVLTGNTVRFNTLVSGFSPTDDCKLQPSNSCTVSNNNFYGNVLVGGCPPGDPIYGGGWTAQYNVWAGSGGSGTICSADTTSTYAAGISLVSPSGVSFDDHLAGCSQPAANRVPTSVSGGYPSTDIDGSARPKGGALDAGAHEAC